MPARRGAQFVPIGMPIICWKTFPPKVTKIHLPHVVLYLGSFYSISEIQEHARRNRMDFAVVHVQRMVLSWLGPSHANDAFKIGPSCIQICHLLIDLRTIPETHYVCIHLLTEQ